MIDRKRTVIFAPQHNSLFKKDATGAFQPEAIAFADYHDIDPKNVFFLNNKLPRKAVRGLIKDIIAEYRPYNLAFFCHGWKNGIQLGFDTSNIEQIGKFDGLANPIITLYSCSCGTGQNIGFADMFRDYLCGIGCIDNAINAHYTAGHTTKNPFVRRFEGRSSLIGGIDGSNIVSPKRKAEFAKWSKLLQKTVFRFAYPFMSYSEIHSVIDSLNENLYPTI